MEEIIKELEKKVLDNIRESDGESVCISDIVEIFSEALKSIDEPKTMQDLFNYMVV